MPTVIAIAEAKVLPWRKDTDTPMAYALRAEISRNDGLRIVRRLGLTKTPHNVEGWTIWDDRGRVGYTQVEGRFTEWYVSVASGSASGLQARKDLADEAAGF